MSGWLEVLVLGVLQGLTEFLPVSSSGHLAVGQMVLGLKEGNLALSVILHAGTLLATLVYFRRQIGVIVYELAKNWNSPARALAGRGGVDAKVVILASIPTAVVGLILEPYVERWTLQPTVVAGGFFVTALLLLTTARLRPGNLDAPSSAAALLVGLAQAAAVMPGISRSGATIVALLLLGVRSARSFELSMLISLPAVFGAFVLELLGEGTWTRPAPELAFGAAVAFGVGLWALRLLSNLVTRGRLAWFALWVLPLGLLVLMAVPE
jgi:undecaprenyl-diphosphatase